MTDKGKPIARLVPIPSGDGLGELAASGRAVLAIGDVLELGSPLPPATGKPLPSETLGKARADER